MAATYKESFRTRSTSLGETLTLTRQSDIMSVLEREAKIWSALIDERHLIIENNNKKTRLVSRVSGRSGALIRSDNSPRNAQGLLSP
jgi:hypothetical protein